MDKISTISIDIAKENFQILGVTNNKKIALEKKTTREGVFELLKNVPQSATIYMEACGGANYLGRRFEEKGYKVKLIAPQLVKPYLKGQKNDKNDARAIHAAASDITMRFVPVKSLEVQDLQTITKIRRGCVKEKVALANMVRAILYERGVVKAKGQKSLKQAIEQACKEEMISPLILNEITRLKEQLEKKIEHITYYDKLIRELIKKEKRANILTTIPGVGIIVASSLFTAMSTPEQFRNGRHFSAFLGLVPKQNSSGGKEVLGGITKAGNPEVRALLIQSAHVVMNCAAYEKNKEVDFYKKLRVLIESKGKKKAAVAIAAKLARIAFQCCKGNCRFEEPKLKGFHLERMKVVH